VKCDIFASAEYRERCALSRTHWYRKLKPVQKCTHTYEQCPYTHQLGLPGLAIQSFLRAPPSRPLFPQFEQLEFPSAPGPDVHTTTRCHRSASCALICAASERAKERVRTHAWIDTSLKTRRSTGTSTSFSTIFSTSTVTIFSTGTRTIFSTGTCEQIWAQ